MYNVFYMSLLNPCLPSGTQQGHLDPLIAGDNQVYEFERIIFNKKTIDRTVYQIVQTSFDATVYNWLQEDDLANDLNLQ